MQTTKAVKFSKRTKLFSTPLKTLNAGFDFCAAIEAGDIANLKDEHGRSWSVEVLGEGTSPGRFRGRVLFSPDQNALRTGSVIEYSCDVIWGIAKASLSMA